jgi:hypothetical protein
MANQVRRETGSGTDLWRVIAPLILWALHFLFCYVWVAIYCEKAGRAAQLGDARTAVAWATVAVLFIIVLNMASLWRIRRRSLTDDDFEFEHNSPEERHRFLGHMGLMLSVLSVVGVIYVAAPIFMLGTCR